MASRDAICQPTTLHEAINIIKFLNTTHKEEIRKWKEAYQNQAAVIKTLEANRKKELEFLSNELRNYEVALAVKSEAVANELKTKEQIIQSQLQTIEELNRKLELRPPQSVPNITIQSIDSNSDSGIALEQEESQTEVIKDEIKTRKCTRRFAESIRFFRRVDFSPRKYKSRDVIPKNNKVDELKKNHLNIPLSRRIFFGSDVSLSDDNRSVSTEYLSLDESIGSLAIKPNSKNDSMNNHFSDDGSEDTSEEIFNRVMTRSSLRRSVKANPKYKKINRTKSKLLEQVKNNIVN